MLEEMDASLIQHLAAINQHIEAMYLAQPDIIAEDNAKYFTKYMGEHSVSLPLSDHNAIGPLNVVH
jgi:hypothetical protein